MHHTIHSISARLVHIQRHLPMNSNAPKEVRRWYRPAKRMATECATEAVVHHVPHQHEGPHRASIH